MADHTDPLEGTGGEAPVDELVLVPPRAPLPAPAPSARAETERALVVGFGRSGQAVARHLLVRGTSVAVVDDAPDHDARAAAAALALILV